MIETNHKKILMSFLMAELRLASKANAAGIDDIADQHKANLEAFEEAIWAIQKRERNDYE